MMGWLCEADSELNSMAAIRLAGMEASETTFLKDWRELATVALHANTCTLRAVPNLRRCSAFERSLVGNEGSIRRSASPSRSEYTAPSYCT